jgi:hypothetical protein
VDLHQEHSWQSTVHPCGCAKGGQFTVPGAERRRVGLHVEHGDQGSCGPQSVFNRLDCIEQGIYPGGSGIGMVDRRDPNGVYRHSSAHAAAGLAPPRFKPLLKTTKSCGLPAESVSSRLDYDEQGIYPGGCWPELFPPQAPLPDWPRAVETAAQDNQVLRTAGGVGF